MSWNRGIFEAQRWQRWKKKMLKQSFKNWWPDKHSCLAKFSGCDITLVIHRKLTWSRLIWQEKFCSVQNIADICKGKNASQRLAEARIKMNFFSCTFVYKSCVQYCYNDFILNLIFLKMFLHRKVNVEKLHNNVRILCHSCYSEFWIAVIIDKEDKKGLDFRQ